MRNWEETCIGDGAELVCKGVICNETPDAEADDDRVQRLAKRWYNFEHIKTSLLKNKSFLTGLFFDSGRRVCQKSSFPIR